MHSNCFNTTTTFELETFKYLDFTATAVAFSITSTDRQVLDCRILHCTPIHTRLLNRRQFATLANFYCANKHKKLGIFKIDCHNRKLHCRSQINRCHVLVVLDSSFAYTGRFAAVLCVHNLFRADTRTYPFDAPSTFKNKVDCFDCDQNSSLIEYR